MTDLVQRLRDAAARKWPDPHVAAHSMFSEAADEIERLRGAMAADDERLRKAGERVGIGCDTAEAMADETERRVRRHDHRGSLWLIAGGKVCWCYQCGAWRPNTTGRMRWHRTTGIGGPNPGMLGDGRP